ncbi:MAG: hypothetical protein JWR00_586 [Rubritepida sp.]|nr:hypothetical protein [Rubritepida sp.]
MGHASHLLRADEAAGTSPIIDNDALADRAAWVANPRGTFQRAAICPILIRGGKYPMRGSEPAWP